MNDHVVMPMLSIASTSTGWFSHVAVENVGPVSLCRESPADVNTATSSDCVHSSVATCAEAKAAPVKREARSIFQNLNGIRVMYKGYKQATHSHQCDDCILDQLPKNMKLKLSPNNPKKSYHHHVWIEAGHRWLPTSTPAAACLLPTPSAV